MLAPADWPPRLPPPPYSRQHTRMHQPLHTGLHPLLLPLILLRHRVFHVYVPHHSRVHVPLDDAAVVSAPVPKDARRWTCTPRTAQHPSAPSPSPCSLVSQN
ncbi:hypothetical protein B0H14DRAFT_3426361 [Mycena olivaceomarginata]|nr:hypothetical protein B0H14DRAFT_3426361 [Mycena olivaceomarginata]